MASGYTAIVHLRADEHSQALAPVLQQVLDDEANRDRATVSMDDDAPGGLLITIDTSADDSSVAQRETLARVTRAVRVAGLSRPDVIDLRDIDIRSSS